MAEDDITKTFGDLPDAEVKKFANALEQLSRMQERVNDSVRRSADPMTKFESNFGRLNRRVGESEKQFESLNDVLLKQIKDIKEAAMQVGSLQSQFADVGGAVVGFINKLKTTISVSNVYNRMMTEMREGQKAFSSSVYATTDAMGQAQAQSQRFVDSVHDAYADARDVAAQYGVEVDKVRKISDGLMSRFKGQLAAQSDMSGSLRSLTRQTFLFARYMGVDSAEATALLEERMQSSNKTLGEAKREMIGIARQADILARGIKTLGDRFMKTGRVSRREFLGIIKGMQGAFKTGVLDAEAYSAAVTKSILSAAKSGMTATEQATVATGFGQLMAGLQKANNLFGMNLAKAVDGMEGRLDQIANKQTRERVKAVLERTKGQADIIRWRELIGAVRGDAQMGAMILDQLKEQTGGDYGLLTTLVQNTSGLEAYQSGTLAQLIQQGKLQDAMRKVAPTTKEGKKAHEEQLDVFKTKFEELMEKGHTPAKLQYQTAKKAYELQQKLYKIFENHPLMMMAITAGIQLIAARLLLGGAGGISGMFGGLFSRGAAGAAGAAGATGAAAVGTAGATTAARTGIMARAAGAGRFLAGAAGTLLVVKTVSDAVTGVLSGKTMDEKIARGVAGITGLKFGHQIDKWVGKTFDLGEKAGKPRIGGQDRSLSGWLSTQEWFVGPQNPALKKMEKEMTRIRGVVTPQMRKESQMLTERIKKARENWDKLTPVQKKQIEKMQDYNNMLKRRIRLDKEGAKVDIARSKWLKETTAGQRVLEAGRIRQALQSQWKEVKDPKTGEVSMQADLRGGLLTHLKSIKDPRQLQAMRDVLTDPTLIQKNFTRSQRLELAKVIRDPEVARKIFGGDENLIASARQATMVAAPGIISDEARGGSGEAFKTVLQMGLGADIQKDLAEARKNMNLNVNMGVQPGEGGGVGGGIVRPDASGKVRLPVTTQGTPYVEIEMGSLAVATQNHLKRMQPKSGKP